jgi:hypothetical protein
MEKEEGYTLADTLKSKGPGEGAASSCDQNDRKTIQYPIKEGLPKRPSL